MQRQTQLLALPPLAGILVFTACATLQSLLPNAPALAASLLLDLDKSLEVYESATITDDASPELALALEAIQTARRRLIKNLLDCLASQYPDIPLTPYLERFNDAHAIEPLLE